MNAKLSIVVPFYNEEETIAEVIAEIVRTVPGAEVIAVDDGSRDRTWEILSAIPGIRAMRFPQNRGQSAAMYAGMRQASGDIVALMDGDGQNDPADFPKLVEALEQGADVACGYRANRQDTASRRYASKIANGIRRTFLHDGVRDTGCSLKAFRREAVDHLVPFNGMHRYIPAQLLRAGLKIVELPVNHRGRMAGTSKYTNWDRALRGIHDLIGVSWLLKRKVNIRFD
ncbi:glycosyltransferase family 2 protein [Luteolibacter ambystomatis]|uniref:Glycosyltransferase family 2 protein n=1 Tax=Luteolibacter ambystomatis TaxID=2824561 RepID=A0A975G6N2_9BACT|nr:glycosyltransferase family 2 protein [Luteolibacter ambystomatis]QUE49775.1 glycosyltransferase family 2 protein [Luteolibacter ambystomatis]